MVKYFRTVKEYIVPLCSFIVLKFCSMIIKIRGKNKIKFETDDVGARLVWISCRREKKRLDLGKQQKGMSMEVTVLRPLVIAGKPTLPLLRPKILHLLRLSLPLRLPHLSSSSTSRLTSPSLFFSQSIAAVSKLSSSSG